MAHSSVLVEVKLEGKQTGGCIAPGFIFSKEGAGREQTFFHNNVGYKNEEVVRKTLLLPLHVTRKQMS